MTGTTSIGSGNGAEDDNTEAPAAPLDESSVVEVRLENGLTALLVQLPAAPVVSVQAWYRVGSREEEKGKTGLAHFLEHLMFKGTAELRRGDIDLVTLRNGGNNNADTTTDRTRYYFNFAADRYERALEIEADRMRGSAFDEHEFQLERGPVLEELRRDRDDPWWCLHESLEATAFQVHPYRNPVIGWAEEVVRVPRSDVLAFYEAWYQPAGCTLVIAGDIDFAEAEARVRRLFEPIPARPLPDPFVPSEPRQEGERRFELELDVQVPRMLAAFHTVSVSDERDIVLDVVQVLLAGGRASALYNRLVRTEQVAAEVHAWNDTRRDPGLFFVSMDLVEGADPAAAEASLWEEIERLATDGPDPANLERARALLVASRVYRRSTSAGVAESIGTLQILAGDWRLYLTEDKRVAAVTAEDIQRVAAEFLIRRNRTVGWALPRPDGTPARPPIPGDEIHELDTDEPEDERPAPAIVGRLPPSGGLRIDLPAKRVVWENGLRVLLMPRSDLPLVALRLWCDSGQLRERLPGQASLTGAAAEEGAGGRGGAEIASLIESVGAHIATGAGGAALRCLTQHTDLALEVLSDLMLRPDFPADGIERRRGQLLAQLMAEDDDPATVGALRLRSEIYGAHPYGRRSKGSAEALKSLSRDQLVAHHRATTVPRGAVLCAVGDFDVDEMESRLRARFGDWEDRAPDVPEFASAPAPSTGRTINVTQDRDQLHLYLGHLGVRRSDPDYYALLVGDFILGSGPGFTDRLSRQLRDREGLAYTVRAGIAASSDLEPGLFTAYIGTSPKTRGQAETGMRREIERFVAGPIEEQELADAKSYLTGSYVFGFESAHVTCAQLVQIERLGLGLDHPARFIEAIQSVTVDDVQSAVRRRIQPQNLITVAVGRV